MGFLALFIILLFNGGVKAPTPGLNGKPLGFSLWPSPWPMTITPQTPPGHYCSASS